MDWVETLPSTTLSSFPLMLSTLGTRAGVFTALLYAFTSGIVPGVTEELLFRGVLQTTFTRWFGLPVALPLQAILFGIAHYNYNSKAYIALTGLIGCLMGAIFSWTGNLAVPILLHAGMNIHGALTFRSLVTHFTTYDLGKVQEIYYAKRNDPLWGKKKSSLF